MRLGSPDNQPELLQTAILSSAHTRAHCIVYTLRILPPYTLLLYPELVFYHATVFHPWLPRCCRHATVADHHTADTLSLDYTPLHIIT